MRRHAFSLVELLVVIAIIGVLIALLLPAIQKVRESANRSTCLNNLHQLAIAAQGYHDVAQCFPYGHEETQHGQHTFRGNTVFARLLAHLEQDNIARQWSFIDPFLNVVQSQTSTTSSPSAASIPSLICRSDLVDSSPFNLANENLGSPYQNMFAYGYYASTSYAGNAGTYSNFPTDIGFKTDGTLIFKAMGSNVQPVSISAITDGSSNTLLFGEKYHYDSNFDQIDTSAIDFPIKQWSAWAIVGGYCGSGHVLASSRKPLNYATPPAAIGTSGTQGYSWKDQRLSAFGSGHTGGANFAFADGSVRFISNGINATPGLFDSLCGRANGVPTQDY